MLPPDRVETTLATPDRAHDVPKGSARRRWSRPADRQYQPPDRSTMYDFLRGTVAPVDAGGRLSFDVGGVGYSLRVSEQTRRAIPLDGQPLVLHVRLQVKDDDLVLFGFIDVAERAA